VIKVKAQSRIEKISVILLIVGLVIGVVAGALGVYFSAVPAATKAGYEEGYKVGYEKGYAAGKAAAPPVTVPKGPIVVGALLPITHETGIRYKWGLDLAIEEINAKGGVDGRPIVVQYLDSKRKADASVSAAHKFVTEYKVSLVLGPGITPTCAAVAPIFEEAHLPSIGCSRANEMTGAGGLKDPYKYWFRLAPSAELLGKKAAEDIKKLGLGTKIAYLYIDTGYGASTFEATKKYAEKLGLKTVYEEKFPRGTKDFSAYMAKIKAIKPDVLLWVGYVSEGIAGITEFKEQGLDKVGIKLYSASDHPTLSTVVKALGDKLEGCYIIAPYIAGILPTAKDFEEKFKAKYGEYPDIFGAYGYVMGWVAYYALKKASPLTGEPKKDREKITEALYTIKFDSIFGPDTYFDKSGQLVVAGEYPACTVVYKKGNWVRVT